MEATMFKPNRVSLKIFILQLIVLQLRLLLVEGNLKTLVNLNGELFEPEENLHLVRPELKLDKQQLEELSRDVESRFGALPSISSDPGDESDIGSLSESDWDSDSDSDSDYDERPSVFGRLAEVARRAIAPARNYYNLVQRYRRWYQDYSAVQQGLVRKDGSFVLPDPLEMLRLEYAKVDKLLMEEACNSSRTKSLDSVENVDFVLNVLNLLIGRLEKRLADIKSMDGEQLLMRPPSNIASRREPAARLSSRSILEAAALAKLERVEEETGVQEAVERAKRIAKRTARTIALREIRQVVKIVAFNALANNLVEQRQSGQLSEVLTYLEPVVLLIGSTNTPLTVAYLRDIQFRSTIGLVSYLNPISWIRGKCSMKPEGSDSQSVDSIRAVA